jgi:hypothetical protein
MGKAGQSVRRMAAQRRSKSLIFAFIALGIAIVILLIATNMQTLGLSGLGLLALVVGLKVFADILTSRSDHYTKLERRALRGARGEEQIGHILDGLGPDFCALHDIDSQFGNIDHIVLSRLNGTFLIETKAHGGKVTVLEDRLLVNGRPPEKDFIKQSLNNSYWLKARFTEALGLDVWITPIVVFTNAFVSRSKPIKGVRVINKKYLRDELQRGHSNPASIELWNNRQNVTNLLGLSTSIHSINNPPVHPLTSDVSVPETPRPAQEKTRPFGLQPQQLKIVIGFFIFDLVLIGTGLVLVLQ